MSFRAINEKYLEPGAQYLMILGIVALCQPWNMLLHQYGLTITLIGLGAAALADGEPARAIAGLG